ncbi:hypothetical protein ROHU_021650 [Labeo rohita]|uniref:Uncharacterized protein n=1 Tax=Labeo rohita TaxID=84645 RepID=A0A498MWS5_LABRO|nr:hypothetical protein ROHU_021650 [Labeo rohita]
MQVWRPDRDGSHRAGKKEGTPAWEGSHGNCWEIKTPGVAPGGGKRRGVWPARQGWRKANPPGRALAATAGRSRIRRCTRRGEEMWSLAHRANREKGKPAWEGSRSD